METDWLVALVETADRAIIVGHRPKCSPHFPRDSPREATQQPELQLKAVQISSKTEKFVPAKQVVR